MPMGHTGGAPSGDGGVIIIRKEELPGGGGICGAPGPPFQGRGVGQDLRGWWLPMEPAPLPTSDDSTAL